MRKEWICQMFSRFPILETDRLILRRMHVSDASDMYAYARSEEVTEYLTWMPHKDRKYTEEYLRYLEGRYRSGTFYDWAVEYKPDGHMIGTCGFTSFDYSNNSAEIGYVLNPTYHRQGLAAEAARAVLAFGFGQLKLHRIEAHYMVENTPSLKVMQKLGMKPEGVRRGGMLIKGQYRDIGVCAILREEYFSGR